jgi:hypothetical protein
LTLNKSYDVDCLDLVYRFDSIKLPGMVVLVVGIQLQVSRMFCRSLLADSQP